ncbi:MAG: PolC-type DNA polymerase III [Clostridia bacterium]|nr:PolC-type DNA polymerase III [Clostridia bacterium]
MLEEFLQKFKKAVFTEKQKKTISGFSDYTLSTDRVNKRIAVKVSAREYIPPRELFSIEDAVKRAYEVNSVEFFPVYEGVEFSENYVPGVIETLKRSSKLDYGFFDGCECSYSSASRRCVITLRPFISADYLELNGAKNFIVQCVRAQFGTELDLYIEENTPDFSEYSNDRQSNIDESIRQGLAEVASEREKAKPSSSITGETQAQEPVYSRAEGENTVRVGQMTLDLSDIKPVFGVRKSWDLTPIANLKNGEQVCVGGKMFLAESKENYEGDKIVYTVYITDYSASVSARFSFPKDDAPSIPESPAYVLIAGRAEHRTTYDRALKKRVPEDEISINVKAMAKCAFVGRKDDAEEKRVELHLHTNMSKLDALSDPSDILARAEEWGMPAVAFTDHGTLQSYPIVMKALKKHPGVKPIYGIEGYLVDDTARAVFRCSSPEKIDFGESEFIIFDIETTGLSYKTCGITQIGAIKYKSEKTVDEFRTFVNPGMHIPEDIEKLTGISDETVKDAPCEKDAVEAFLRFCGGSMLIAHNAGFDVSFISRVAADNGIPFENPYLDTVALSRYINNDISRHTLDSLAKYYRLGDFDHHRADADTEMLARIFACMVGKLAQNGIYNVAEMNAAMAANCDPKRIPAYHITILVKNQVGLKNLYKLVSRSYLDYYSRYPRIPKTLLSEYREGLVLGSACSSGELYDAILRNQPESRLLKIADFYDYLEIMPDSNNGYLVESGELGADRAAAVEQLHENNRTIIRLAEKQNKPFVATGDVHFMDPEDEIYRQIMLYGVRNKSKGRESDALRTTGLYFRTTNEMLAEFAYLGEETARKAVIANPKAVIADFENVKPIPDGQYTPYIEGAEQELQQLCENTAHEMYGEELPEIVKTRMDRELGSIIKNGYAVLYVIARRLVQYSEENGYLVGSRGSVGSSFVATLAKISEVNPLPPHYVCPECKHSEFFTNGEVGSGFDLDDKNCPVCGALMRPDGHDIPFETFLGFHGEKAPDIDLNFSGDVQTLCHKYTETLFGKENIFRAGTVGTLQEKNCYGYVKKYLEEHGGALTRAETARIAYGFVGVKNTTGQHPGGIVVIPKEYEIYDFTPVQYPAEKESSGVITTHFAFEYLHDTLLKLDMLGHDVPTFYHILEQYTGIDVRTVKMNDKKVIDLFAGTEPLGVTPEQIGCRIGTLGLPEFGTDYAIQMIIDAKPKTFADLLQISGLSHGTGIWLGNGKDLIDNGVCTISEIIGTRDSIMLYLMQKGLDSSTAFNSMERTRKGKGLLPEQEEEMRAHSVPEWYIESCNKIKYMFPKAHAAAYTIASLRLGWFKVYRPLEYYATYFTVKADNFDGELVMGGKHRLEERLRAIKEMPNPTKKEEDAIVFIRVVLEMFARGIGFLPVSIGRSEAKAFVPENGKIRLPLCSLNGLGESVAEKIVSVIKNGEAVTVEELRVKASINKAIMDILVKNDCLGDLPETDQITMF